MDKSALIIGGGIGGLFTGAILAKEGVKVTLIEKNSTVGGGLQSFVRFGEVFDTGMHIACALQPGGNVRRVCDYLGISRELHLGDSDPEKTYSIYVAQDKKEYVIACGRKRFVDTLAAYFPEQKENLKKYVDAMYRITDSIDLFNLRPSSSVIPSFGGESMKSAIDFISGYITDERLRSLVSFVAPLYGGCMDTTPAYIHSILSVLYLEGTSHFAGGSRLFAESLKNLIIANGGRVIVGDAVASVSTMDKMITGVTTSKGLVFSADRYICAIHPCTFFQLMEDVSVLPGYYRNRLDALPNSYSAFKLNIKFKSGTFRYFSHSAYYLGEYEYLKFCGRKFDVWPQGFLYMTPPELSQGEYARKMIIFAPMEFAQVKPWEDSVWGSRPEEYVRWKEERTERILDCLEEIFPDFRSCIEAIDSSSPLTIRDFYGVKDGSISGFLKDCNNIFASQVPVFTKIPNLLLTGQNCSLHGLCGVTLTAINTCEAILGQNYLFDKLNRFNDIRPYFDSEISPAMQRLASSPDFEALSRFVFPERNTDEVRGTVSSISTSKEFQMKVMDKAIRTIVKKSMTDFSYSGTDNISRDSGHLFVSNHRDIALDASLLQIILIDCGLDTTEITFGANLMKGELVIDIGKSNKMFRVERPGNNMREFYNASIKLSDYIRSTILEKGQSVWIANRNGRTKDGIDRTDQGIIRMFGMSGTSSAVKSLAELNIVPVSVSYEWEPCGLLKAVELYESSRGPYHKKEGEDLHSIITGILQPKGRVHVEICHPVTEDELAAFEELPVSEVYRRTAALLDRRICSAYRLFPNNFIAHDIRSGTSALASYYTSEQKEEFLSYLTGLGKYSAEYDIDELRRILLGIYANPVDSSIKFSESHGSAKDI